jgi:hypothetical protein
MIRASILTALDAATAAAVTELARAHVVVVEAAVAS